MSSFLLLFSLIFVVSTSCKEERNSKELIADNFTPNQPTFEVANTDIICGAERIGFYTPQLMDKKVGLVANQSSRIANKHLLDSLLELGIQVEKIFTPEHGFRGEADAGQKIDNQIDPSSGLPIISLYGDDRKPKPEDLQDLDIVIFDIQDVGVRFYTFISTLHYVMEACAESKKKLLLLDRPNPNAHYVDGPLLDVKYKSFVGMHAVPVVYGMTIGEYAKMINGEGWLDNGVTCELEVVELKNYNHKKLYELPVKPSPNLPNLRSILLYPSLCYFEPTVMSIGRGTNKQFQVIGHPKWVSKTFQFTPQSNPGAQNPKLKGELCNGLDLTIYSAEIIKSWKGINLAYLISAFNDFEDKSKFITSPSFFDKLAGSDVLRKQLLAGSDESQIKDSWQKQNKEFMHVRSKYLLYK